jgi:hypothetical protein
MVGAQDRLLERLVNLHLLDPHALTQRFLSVYSPPVTLVRSSVVEVSRHRVPMGNWIHLRLEHVGRQPASHHLLAVVERVLGLLKQSRSDAWRIGAQTCPASRFCGIPAAGFPKMWSFACSNWSTIARAET